MSTIAVLMAAFGGATSPPLPAEPYLNVSRTITATGVLVKGSGSVSGRFTLSSTGAASYIGDSCSPAIDTDKEWLSALGNPSDWHVKCTYTGTAPNIGDSTGVWLAMTSTRYWGHTITDTIEVRNTALTLAFSNDGGTTTHSTFAVTNVNVDMT